MELKEAIASHALFAGLSDEMIAMVSECASAVHFEAGAYLFHEGEEARTFYLIQEGSIALQAHAPERSSTVLTIGKDNVVGVSWLVPPYRLGYDGKALSPVSALAFDAACLRAKCEGNYELGYEVMKRFAAMLVHRLHTTRFQMIDVYSA